MKTQITKIIVAIIVLLLIGGSYMVWKKGHLFTSNSSEPVACTLDAKICPDGSAVGRTGPNCEFAMCPGENQDTDVWNTKTDAEHGVSFEYPNNISTQFVLAVDWPPRVIVSDKAYSCLEAGGPTDPAGQTRKEQGSSGREYCVSQVSEGAAGSIYTQYAYGFSFEEKTAIFIFTIRTPQCLNYDEPNATACAGEQKEFMPVNQVDRMAATLKKI
ncbi:MAG TPA: hypothetical protein VK145_00735 [Candidatus Nanoarchaeia archaeon]|nr:hypothetical protein [Candidatus Nanoarchaeia archaeon]